MGAMHASDILLGLAALVASAVFSVAITVISGVLYCAWAKRRYSHDAGDAVELAVFRNFRASAFARSSGLAVEIVCQTFALVLRGLHVLRLLPPPRVDGRGTPVLVLPGYVENAGTVWWLARRLARAGFNAILIEFPTTICAIEQNVAYLGRRVEEVREAHAGREVAVVAHSMGGVITRTLMLTRPEHGIRTLVAIGSPFAGTHLARLGARLGIGHCVPQLVPDSSFMQRFPPSLGAPVPMLSLIAPQENIVSPVWSAVVPGAQMHLLKAPYGHEAPLFVRSVCVEVEAWLLARGVERGADAAG
jgi:pimeloyl-ACP methyl ester carboxylesterase